LVQDSHYYRINGLDIASTDMETNEYPGFPTDLQAQWMMLMCLADGVQQLKKIFILTDLLI
jgi:UDP-N-acetylglucosamine 1-carboxyvinyltransferase